MAVNIGSTPIADAKLGSTQVQAIYLGSTKVWEKARVQLPISGVSALAYGGPSTAQFNMYSDGTYDGRDNGSIQSSGYWRLSGASADYDVMLTIISGDGLAGASTGTWLNLGTARTWSRLAAIGQIKSTQAQVQIRDTSTLQVLVTKSFDFYSESA